MHFGLTRIRLMNIEKNALYQLSQIKEIENIQRSFTKYLPGKYNNSSYFDLSYTERLNILKIDSLLYRRIFFDLVMLWKFVHGDIFQNSFTEFFELDNSTRNLRGHSLKIKLKRTKTALYHNFWSIRSILLWNSLKNETVTASNIKIFKKHLSNESAKINDYINKHYPTAFN